MGWRCQLGPQVPIRIALRHVGTTDRYGFNPLWPRGTRRRGPSKEFVVTVRFAAGFVKPFPSTTENTRHRCGGRYRRGTVLGSREMLMYAYNRLKAKNPRAIVKANTNTLATALITSLVDIRLVGEAIDAAGMDEASRRWLHCSYRLGETTEFLWDQTRLSAMQKASFAALVNFLPQWLEHPRFEPHNSFDDFDVFRSHDDGTGDWQLGLSQNQGLRSATPGATVNTVKKGDTTLATVVNTNPAEVTAEIPLRDGWLACEPLSGQLFMPARTALTAGLGPGQYRHFLLLQTPRAPRLLYALGARIPPRQTYNPSSRKMQVRVDAVEGARIRIGVFTPTPIREVTCSKAGRIAFSWKQAASLLTFDVTHDPGEVLEIAFQ